MITAVVLTATGGVEPLADFDTDDPTEAAARSAEMLGMTTPRVEGCLVYDDADLHHEPIVMLTPLPTTETP